MANATPAVTGFAKRELTQRIGVTEVTLTLPWKNADILNKIVQRHRVLYPEINEIATVLDDCLKDEPSESPSAPPPQRAPQQPVPRWAKVGDRIIILEGSMGAAAKHVGDVLEVDALVGDRGGVLVSTPKSATHNWGMVFPHEYAIVDNDTRPLEVGDLVVATDAAIRYRGQISRIKNIVDQAYDEQTERRYFLNLCKYTGFSDNQLVRVLPAPI